VVAKEELAQRAELLKFKRVQGIPKGDTTLYIQFLLRIVRRDKQTFQLRRVSNYLSFIEQ